MPGNGLDLSPGFIQGSIVCKSGRVHGQGPVFDSTAALLGLCTCGGRVSDPLGCLMHRGLRGAGVVVWIMHNSPADERVLINPAVVY